MAVGILVALLWEREVMDLSVMPLINLENRMRCTSELIFPSSVAVTSDETLGPCVLNPEVSRGSGFSDRYVCRRLVTEGKRHVVLIGPTDKLVVAISFSFYEGHHIH